MGHKQQAISGGKWMSFSTTLSTIFQFGQVALLARLLEPSVFGIVSVSTLIIAFFSIFANLGFSNSIIYKQEEDQQVLSTIYLLNLILGLLVGAVVFMSWPLVVAYYKEPRLEQVIKLSSLYFVIVYIGQIYLFLLQKELRFKAVASIDIAGTLVGSFTTILLAYLGFAELALIYGQLAQQTLKSVLQSGVWLSLFSPVLAFDLSLIKDHLRFGLYNVGDGIVGFIQANSDNILVGGMLGVKQLGYYTLASQLAVFPISRLSPIVLQVAYPILARLKGDTNELKKSYLTILDLLSYCQFTAAGGLVHHGRQRGAAFLRAGLGAHHSAHPDFRFRQHFHVPEQSAVYAGFFKRKTQTAVFPERDYAVHQDTARLSCSLSSGAWWVLPWLFWWPRCSICLSISALSTR